MRKWTRRSNWMMIGVYLNLFLYCEFKKKGEFFLLLLPPPPSPHPS